MDVDGASLHRGRVAELLHAVDQGADAVGLVADQLDQRQIVLAHGRLQQLGGATDAGQGILHLMRQRGGQPRYRPGGTAVRDLLVEPTGHRAGMQHDQHMLREFRDRADMAVHRHRLAARQDQLDAIVRDRGAGGLYLPDESQYRRVRCDELGHAAARQDVPAGAEQLLGGGIGEAEAQSLVDGEHRAGNALEQHPGVDAPTSIPSCSRRLPLGAHVNVVRC